MTEKSALDEIMTLCGKVTSLVIDYHCDDGYDKKLAEKLEHKAIFMIHHYRYQEAGLPVLQLMLGTLDLILHPDEYKDEYTDEDFEV